MIQTGDCIEVMAGMQADSVDAVVTDPPYGLEFMGREWDKFDGGQQARWEGRKQKAGRFDQHGLGSSGGLSKRMSARPSFGTDSRGQKCRKCGHYKFSGTPCKCAEPEWEIRTGTPPNMAAFQAWCEAWGREALRVTKPGGYLLAFGGTRTHHRLVCGLEDAGWIIRDELTWVYAQGFPKGRANLKPAHEPIVLARKPGPLRPLNIEETRIGTSKDVPASPRQAQDRIFGRYEAQDGTEGGHDPNLGRWPSNLLLSDPELFDEPNPWVVGSGATASQSPAGVYGKAPDDYDNGAIYGGGAGYPKAGVDVYGYGDSGGYSRFFIIPKADRADREPVLRGQLEKVPGGAYAGGEGMPGRTQIEGQWVQTPIEQRKARENSHATVKPTDLMRHLIRLVTPPGGTVLDPFLGSGSTAIAAELEGFPWIGIEKEPEYVAIAEARLNGTQRGLGLDVPAPTRKRSAAGEYQRVKPMGPGAHFKGMRQRSTDEEPAA